MKLWRNAHQIRQLRQHNCITVIVRRLDKLTTYVSRRRLRVPIGACYLYAWRCSLLWFSRRRAVIQCVSATEACAVISGSWLVDWVVHWRTRAIRQLDRSVNVVSPLWVASGTLCAVSCHRQCNGRSWRTVTSAGTVSRILWRPLKEHSPLWKWGCQCIGFKFIQLLLRSYDYSMHVACLQRAHLCLVTSLGSEQWSQFEGFRLQHVQMVTKIDWQ